VHNGNDELLDYVPLATNLILAQNSDDGFVKKAIKKSVLSLLSFNSQFLGQPKEWQALLSKVI
jgi:hypothetical protein